MKGFRARVVRKHRVFPWCFLVTSILAGNEHGVISVDSTGLFNFDEIREL